MLLPLATLQGRPSTVEQRSAQRAALVITSEPEVIVNGSPCLFRVKSRRALRSLYGEWQGRGVFFKFDERDGAWYGLAGAPLDAGASRNRLTLEAVTAGGGGVSHVHPRKSGPARYHNTGPHGAGPDT